MKTALAVLSIAVMTTAAAPVPEQTAARKCRTIFNKADAEAGVAPRDDKDEEAMLIRAVDRRVAGCRVLMLAPSGEIVEGPVAGQRRPLLQPAQ
jgi:hypothetical protein